MTDTDTDARLGRLVEECDWLRARALVAETERDWLAAALNDGRHEYEADPAIADSCVASIPAGDEGRTWPCGERQYAAVHRTARVVLDDQVAS